MGSLFYRISAGTCYFYYSHAVLHKYGWETCSRATYGDCSPRCKNGRARVWAPTRDCCEFRLYPPFRAAGAAPERNEGIIADSGKIASGAHPHAGWGRAGAGTRPRSFGGASTKPYTCLCRWNYCATASLATISPLSMHTQFFTALAR